ncbi:hypothetical protein MN0502_05330 [Arthrobacter sp. MN05-02]|nr:hypothetical protein MN0502_05330 [Arthrobacter sp. MN05-02]
MTGMPRSAAIFSDSPHAVVHLDADRDVQRLRRDARAEGLHHRVAAGHGLLGGLALGTARAGVLPAGTLGRRTLGELLVLVRLVVRAVLRLGSGSLALERLASVAAGADGGALFRFANRAWTSVTGHGENTFI